ncbi:MAG TPA: putative peptidoglycan glycosyltransferase FtsW [Planctomycetota bacterium]|nr:cell division protein FtsW [Planctomycetota bacterium]OQC20991.1 MAG: Lipid II flippase FtsW [Planctomycetes bacterium ADurb.Bin069]HNR98485.1 putative peptidoglycan glycosyltransferase FtsW [Planctomycetota bacterium]HNU25095.1 putative peptidoglycan glycosyltransferase FtsW [Planctomycetota bacterium]HOE30083.1 putative peptidoglycan glycosyltransferase FtsW [Planctomycetota bacterium]
MSREGRWILWAAGGLFVIGLVMVFSASACRSIMKFQAPHLWFGRQLLYSVVALACFAVLYAVDYRRLLALWPYIFGATVIALALVFVPPIGRRINDSARWIKLGGYFCQPSEFAKLTLIICTAGFLAQRRERIDRFFGTFVPAMLGVGVYFGLILAEPDLGTAAFVFSFAIVLLLVAGVRVWYLGIAGVLASPAIAAVAYLKWDKIVSRFQGVLNPGDQPQVHQSLVALGSGGLAGKGLGAGTQKLGHLPECFTDFIFGVFGEECGYLGVCVVLALYAVLLVCGLRIALRARDFSGFLIAFGAVFSLVFQAVVNIAVVSGAAPTKGISLPLMSYGGSGLALAFAEIGLILNVARRTYLDELRAGAPAPDARGRATRIERAGEAAHA